MLMEKDMLKRVFIIKSVVNKFLMALAIASPNLMAYVEAAART